MSIQTKVHRVGQLLLGALISSAAVAYAGLPQAGAAQPPIPRGVPMRSWHENGHDGRYLLQIVGGAPGKIGKRMIGTIVTDTDCDADAEGLSHCRNNIELANGRRITVIDTHEMHRYRCLEPGEKVSLSEVGNSWLIGTVSMR